MAATNSPSSSRNPRGTTRIVSRTVSVKFSPAMRNSPRSPRVSASPSTAAMANVSNNFFPKRTRISTQKKQSGEDAPPRLIPAVELPNRELLQLTSLFVRTTRRKRRKLFGDFRLVPHHNDGHLFRLNVFRRHFLDVRERNRNHFLHIRFQIVFAQSLQIHIPELSDQRAS